MQLSRGQAAAVGAVPKRQAARESAPVRVAQRLQHSGCRFRWQRHDLRRTASTFTVSRSDFTTLSGSAGASNFSQYVVANHLLDSSGAPQLDFEMPGGSPAGFAFVNQTGYFTMSNPTVSGTGQNGPGTIAQVEPEPPAI